MDEFVVFIIGIVNCGEPYVRERYNRLTPCFDLRLRSIKGKMKYLVWSGFCIVWIRERVFQRRRGFMWCDIVRYDGSISSLSDTALAATTGCWDLHREVITKFSRRRQVSSMRVKQCHSRAQGKGRHGVIEIADVTSLLKPT